MPLYEVKEGATYPFAGRELQPGETIELTEGQAAPWLGLLLKSVAQNKPEADSAPRQESEVDNVG